MTPVTGYRHVVLFTPGRSTLGGRPKNSLKTIHKKSLYGRFYGRVLSFILFILVIDLETIPLMF